MLSPTSTTVELEEVMKGLEDGDQKMRHMVAFYPHHRLPNLRDDQTNLILKAEWSELANVQLEAATGDEAKGNTEGAKTSSVIGDETAAQEEIVWEAEDSRNEDLPVPANSSNVTIREGKRKETRMEDTMDFTVDQGSRTQSADPLEAYSRIIPPHVPESPWKSPSAFRDVHTSALLGPSTPFGRGAITKSFPRSTPTETGVDPEVAVVVVEGMVEVEVGEAVEGHRGLAGRWVLRDRKEHQDLREVGERA
ncbi:hypothetical protein B0H13DRAFT_2387811 [Mycena leptocephala]|nr:hypothetical protein B0H13DRAFT_2387811 [Mycena leptocephala]